MREALLFVCYHIFMSFKICLYWSIQNLKSFKYFLIILLPFWLRKLNVAALIATNRWVDATSTYSKNRIMLQIFQANALFHKLCGNSCACCFFFFYSFCVCNCSMAIKMHLHQQVRLLGLLLILAFMPMHWNSPLDR